MPVRVIITVSNDIVTDQRVRRMGKVLRDNAYSISIVGRKLKSEISTDNYPDNLRRFRMIFKKGPFFYILLNIRLFIYLLRSKSDIIIAVDLDTLLAAVLAKKIKKTLLIYDAHEYFTGVPELLNRPKVRAIWKKIENYALPRVDKMITVNNSIARLYNNDYGVNATVIRNIVEDSNRNQASRSELGIEENNIVLIMQGSINMDRGFREAIDAVASLNLSNDYAELPGLKLIIAGSGYALADLKDYVKQERLSDYISFLNRLEWSSMMEYTRMADIGLSIDSSDCLNYRYSLPNKIFEYINSGIAVIATSLPEIKDIIEKHNCGLLIKSNSSENIREAVLRIIKEKGLMAELKANSQKAAREYSWQSEGKKLIDFINSAVS